MAAAAMLCCGMTGTALASGTETKAVLTQGNKAENAVIYLFCSYDGNTTSYTEEARIGADSLSAGTLPGALNGALTIQAGDARLLPYGVRMTLIDRTTSLSNVRLAVWSDENGQDDLVWLPMTGGVGSWQAAFNIADHKSSGVYYLHLYGTRNGAQKMIGALKLNYQPYRVGSGTPAPAPTGGQTSSAKKYNSLFNPQVYYNNYPDLQRTIGMNADALYRHFEQYGIREGRVASNEFNVKVYKANYPDLARAFGTNWKAYFDHYLAFGRAEHRNASTASSPAAAPTNPAPTGTVPVNTVPAPAPAANTQPTNVLPAIPARLIDISPVFDACYYLNRYPDLQAAYGNDGTKALMHFVNYGMKEGRQGCPDFNVKIYQAKYADLQRAYGSNLPAYYFHYITNGMAEHRTAK